MAIHPKDAFIIGAMRLILVAVVGVLVFGCERQDDRIEKLEKRIAELESKKQNQTKTSSRLIKDARHASSKRMSDEEIRDRLNDFLKQHVGYKFGERIEEGSSVRKLVKFPMKKSYAYFSKASLNWKDDGVCQVTLFSEVDKKYSHKTVEEEFFSSSRRLFSDCGSTHRLDQPFNCICKWVTVIMGCDGDLGTNYVHQMQIDDTYSMFERQRRDRAKGIPLPKSE